MSNTSPVHTDRIPAISGRGTALGWGLLLWGAFALAAPAGAQASRIPDELHVDSGKGRRGGRGTIARPFQTLSEALAVLPEPLTESVTIRVRGDHPTTGGAGMPENVLELMLRMRPEVEVRIVGEVSEEGSRPTLTWEGGRAMVDAREGTWSIEGLQIASGSTRQRRGVQVLGPAEVTLVDVDLETRSHSGAGIHAERGGKVLLRGAIRLGAGRHDQAPDDSFCGIVATDHGVVRFRQREGASLDLGNGSLSASYYGCIRLGCETARITCWTDQSNNLAVNNSGRIDLHGTTVTLRARNPRNTPIGLEHDGHILGEDARVTIQGPNSMAIALQKASTFTCNDLVLEGEFDYCVWAASGSMFVGRFLTDVGRIEATTGATIHIEKVDGEIKGPVVARHCGMVSLPGDRNVLPK